MGTAVNHPDHYQFPNGMETVEIIGTLVHKLKGNDAFLFGEAEKHMQRWANGPEDNYNIEDLKNAVWYLQCLISEVETRGKKKLDEVTQKVLSGNM